MPFAKIDDLCLLVSVNPRQICVRFPVGNLQCVSLPQVNIPDTGELLQQMFAQINSALSPLNPIFNIIDAVLAVFECIKAIPKAITELNPVPLIECIPGLAEAINKLIALLPPLSIPVMIVDIIDVVILFLNSLKRQVQILIDRAEAVLFAATKAARPGNIALATSLSCINANFDADIVNLNEQVAPLNRLMGIIDFLLELTGLKKILKQIGLDVMPCLAFGDLSFLENFLRPIDFMVKLLELLRSIIPLPGQYGFSIDDAIECSSKSVTTSPSAVSGPVSSTV